MAREEELAAAEARLASLRAQKLAAAEARLAQLKEAKQSFKPAAAPAPKEPSLLQEAGSTAFGALETAGALASGALAEPMAGVAGTVRGIYGLAAGESKDEALANAARTVEGTRDNLTYSPRGQEARNVLGAVAKVAAPIERGLDIAGEKVANVTGSPLLGALTKAGVEIIPLGRTIPKNVGALAKRNADIKALKEEALKSGVDITAPLETQKKQIILAAQNDTNGRFVIGEDLPQLRDAVIKAKREAKKTADALFDEARANKARFPVKSLQTFIPGVERALSTYDVADMPKVQKRLSELNSIYTNALSGKKKVTMWTTADIQQLENVRRRIISNQPASVDKAQGAALNVLKGQLDRYMDDLFDSGMVSGDKNAIQAWKTARSAWTDYSKRFNEDKVVRKLVKDVRATPEEMKKWIFGASAVGAKPEAGRVVTALKDALTVRDPQTGKILQSGMDSPQFQALRHEILLDVMDPLLRRDLASQNFAQFAVNYEKLVRDNPTVVKEVFDADSLKRLDDLAKSSRGVGKQSPDMLLSLDPNDIIVRLLFGHELAKASARLTVIGGTLGTIGGILRKLPVVGNERRKLIADVSGYSMGAGDWATYGPLQDQAVLQTVLTQAKASEEQDRLEEEKRKQEAFTKRPPPVQTRGTLSPGQGAGPQPPAGGPPPGGPPNTQSRMMLQSLFPNDATLQMPPPQPPMPA